jgi:hypothetical protein
MANRGWLVVAALALLAHPAEAQPRPPDCASLAAWAQGADRAARWTPNAIGSRIALAAAFFAPEAERLFGKPLLAWTAEEARSVAGVFDACRHRLSRDGRPATEEPPLSKAGGGGTALGVLGSRRVPHRGIGTATPLTHAQVSAGVAQEIAELALILKAAAIPPGARWITVHPHGKEHEGQPVLIQPTSDGAYRVIGSGSGPGARTR